MRISPPGSSHWRPAPPGPPHTQFMNSSRKKSASEHPEYDEISSVLLRHPQGTRQEFIFRTREPPSGSPPAFSGPIQYPTRRLAPALARLRGPAFFL
jgi:hypothetical protein